MENWKPRPQTLIERLNELFKELSSAYNHAYNLYRVVRRVVFYFRRKELCKQLSKSIDQGAYKEAISICDHILEIKPNDFNALLQKGIALCKSEIYEEGIEALKRARAINSKNAKVFIELGVAYSRSSRAGRAIENYNRALSYCVNNGIKAKVLALRGDENRQLGRYLEACNDYKRVVGIERENYVVAGKLGLCLYNMGRYKSALDVFQHSLSIKPDYSLAIYYKIISLAGLNQAKDALTCCDELLLVEPESSDYLLLKSRLLSSLYCYDEAIVVCDHVLAISGTNGTDMETESPYRAEAFLGKGNALAGLAWYEKAIAVYDLAIQQSGDDSVKYHVLVAKGQVLEHQKRWGEALEAYCNALHINGESAFVLARCYRLSAIIKLYEAYIVEQSKSLASFSLGPFSVAVYFLFCDS